MNHTTDTGNKTWYVILSLIASVISLIVFFTGNNLPDFLENRSTPFSTKSLSTLPPTPTLVLSQIPTLTPFVSPTFTQSLSQTFDFPTAAIPTMTPEAKLIFSDSFDNGINDYWQTIGDWMVVNGQPVLVNNSQTTNYLSPFALGRGGLILPGVSELDNYAIEFDFYEGLTAILFSYENENNYKVWRLVNNGDDFFIEPGCQLLFISQDNTITIPQSDISLVYNLVSSNHIRVEIRGESLTLYINKTLIYNFKGLPDSMVGSIGIIGTEGKPVMDNINLYQLPE